jgi:2-polyprenyl-3-methyl-5-hydroxy-6-metoxy-1,4-benzoquinol methylase
MIKDRLNRSNIYSLPNFWDQKAENYSDNSVSMWPNNSLNMLYHQEQQDLLKLYFEDLHNKNVVDIGCGVGRMAIYFANHGASVYGFDFSKKTIEIAREKNSHSSIVYDVKSVFEFNEVERFDIAFTWGVLTIACKNQVELDSVVANMNKSIKKDGRLILLEPIHSSFLHRVLRMNLLDFVRILEKNGFKVVEQRQLHFWPARIVLAYIPFPAFITVPVYFIGQFMMKFFSNSGDYKLIYAEKL